MKRKNDECPKPIQAIRVVVNLEDVADKTGYDVYGVEWAWDPPGIQMLPVNLPSGQEVKLTVKVSVLGESSDERLA